MGLLFVWASAFPVLLSLAGGWGLRIQSIGFDPTPNVISSLLWNYDIYNELRNMKFIKVNF
tara:strand:+ start:139 stop:321 length:183 start_codon:yes stop_codon:yes gene_type:complete